MNAKGVMGRILDALSDARDGRALNAVGYSQGRKRVIQRRFNVGVFEGMPG